MSRSTAEAWLQRLAPTRHTLCLGPRTHGRCVSAADFEVWCREHHGARLCLWVAASQLQLLDVQADLPLDDDERDGWARELFAHYLGGQAQRSALAWWRSGAWRGACLAVGVDVEALRATAKRHRVQLLSVMPLWALRLDQALRARPVLRRQVRARVVALEAPWAVVMDLDHGRMSAVHLRRLDACNAAAVQDLLQGLPHHGPVVVLGHGLASTDGLAAPGLECLEGLADAEPTLGGRAPALLDEQPDFSGRTLAALRRRGWAAAGAASLLLALALGQAWVAQDQRARAQARRDDQAWQLARWQRPSRRDGPTAPSAPVPVRPAALDHPWGPLLAAVERATVPGVQWLALDHGVGRDGVRLAGQAPSLQAVMATSQRLGDQPGWQDLLPTALQSTTTNGATTSGAAAAPSPALAGAAGRPPSALRFELSARLDARRLAEQALAP